MAAWSFKDDFWFSVLFVCRQPTDYTVYLVGDFNGWKDVVEEYKMTPCPEGHSVRVELREGFYNYKFSINGEYIRDYSNPHVGGTYNNSVMFVNMDPGVYGLKNQQPPYREYHSDVGGARFIVINPIPPQDLLAEGVLQRQVFLYLPPSYNTSHDKHYPVVYAHDGQNLFSTPSHAEGAPPRGGWYMDAKLDNWWAEGIIPEFILVGVANSDFVCVGNRQREYTCTDMSQIGNEPYVRYITTFLKPLIDSEYRTLKDLSYIIGASLGGLMAFLTTLSLNMFKGCVCMSPALWFVDRNNQTCFDLVKGLSQDTLSGVKIYIDSGDGEGDNKEVVKDMADLLSEHGLVEGCGFMYVLDECKDRVPCGVTHSEWVWRERVLGGLKFVLS